MNAHSTINGIMRARLEATREIDRQVLAALGGAYPDTIPVTVAMRSSGLPVEIVSDCYGGKYSKPVDAFMLFCSACIRADKLLRRYGYSIERSGGTVNDRVWISKQGVSPS